MSEPTDRPDRYASASGLTLIKVLEGLAARPFEPASLAQLQERAGASRDACYRAARTLEAAGWAESCPGGGWKVTQRAAHVSHRVTIALADLHTMYLGGER